MPLFIYYLFVMHRTSDMSVCVCVCVHVKVSQFCSKLISKLSMMDTIETVSVAGGHLSDGTRRYGAAKVRRFATRRYGTIGATFLDSALNQELKPCCLVKECLILYVELEIVGHGPHTSRRCCKYVL